MHNAEEEKTRSWMVSEEGFTCHVKHVLLERGGYEDDGSHEEFDGDAERGPKDHISDVRDLIVTIELRPIFWSCVQLTTDGSEWPSMCSDYRHFLVVVMVLTAFGKTQESGPELE